MQDLFQQRQRTRRNARTKSKNCWSIQGNAFKGKICQGRIIIKNVKKEN
jgi:hypothetical protein